MLRRSRPEYFKCHAPLRRYEYKADCGISPMPQSFHLSKPRKNTPSKAEGLDGDEFRIVGASHTINN
jgi:hypothetical protein